MVFQFVVKQKYHFSGLNFRLAIFYRTTMTWNLEFGILEYSEKPFPFGV